MVIASKDRHPPRVLLYYWIGPVPAHVVVGSDLPLTVLHEEERKAGLGDPDKVAGLDESRVVGYDQPLLRENSPAL